MYREIVRIYTNDIQNLNDTEYWEEIEKRLLFANKKYNMYDDFYISVLIDEMTHYSYFTNEELINGDWYLTYSEETQLKEINLEPELQFTKEDLQDYNKETNNITYKYLER